MMRIYFADQGAPGVSYPNGYDPGARYEIVLEADTDSDGDGIGNNADPDDDNDGYMDAKDRFPLDTDNDGAINVWQDATGDWSAANLVDEKVAEKQRAWEDLKRSTMQPGEWDVAGGLGGMAAGAALPLLIEWRSIRLLRLRLFCDRADDDRAGNYRQSGGL